MESEDGVSFKEETKMIVAQPTGFGFDKDDTYKHSVVYDSKKIGIYCIIMEEHLTLSILVYIFIKEVIFRK